jgi:hypothetical protein
MVSVADEPRAPITEPVRISTAAAVEETLTKGRYGVMPALRGYLKPVGEWNEQVVEAKGNKIKVTLNGQVILNADITDAIKNGTPDKQQHPGLQNKSGHIGFLGHGDVVRFRNIRVKRL